MFGPGTHEHNGPNRLPDKRFLETLQRSANHLGSSSSRDREAAAVRWANDRVLQSGADPASETFREAQGCRHRACLVPADHPGMVKRTPSHYPNQPTTGRWKGLFIYEELLVGVRCDIIYFVRSGMLEASRCVLMLVVSRDCEDHFKAVWVGSSSPAQRVISTNVETLRVFTAVV